MTSSHTRRPFQFSLWTLFVVTSLVALMAAYGPVTVAIVLGLPIMGTLIFWWTVVVVLTRIVEHKADVQLRLKESRIRSLT